MQTRTILIVDDEPRTRQGLKKMLEAWSAGRFQLCAAADGNEALAFLNSQTVHLVITDIRMPEMNGLEFLQAFHTKHNKPAVIILSGYSEFDYAQEAIRLGVLNYLLKPINKQKLIEAVEKALEVQEKEQRTEIMQRAFDSQLVQIKQEDHQTRSPIKEAMQYVDANLKGQLSLREVADHVHLNPSYFSALFKDQTQVTFSEYVTRSRIQNAKHLLIHTDLPITEVAEEVGYQTAKYFIKLFKEYEGITPSQYRKQLTNESDFQK
jgi:two-component system response regulator YesN